jgi:tRNA(Ile)-lysidine synthase TilS/MesJ
MNVVIGHVLDDAVDNVLLNLALGEMFVYFLMRGGSLLYRSGRIQELPASHHHQS